MAAKKKDISDLFEDEPKGKANTSLSVLESPKPKPSVKVKAEVLPPKKPKPKASPPSRQHEDFESGEGQSDYMWAMEDSTTDTAKALEAFMGKGDLRKESELNEDQIRAASLLLEMAGRYKLPRIRNATHHFLACRVSKDRGSRSEAVAAFTGLVENRRLNQTDMIGNALRRET